MRRRWRWPWRRHEANDGAEAVRERVKAERQLRERIGRWPEILQARDELARMAERALRGHP